MSLVGKPTCFQLNLKLLLWVKAFLNKTITNKFWHVLFPGMYRKVQPSFPILVFWCPGMSATRKPGWRTYRTVMLTGNVLCLSINFIILVSAIIEASKSRLSELNCSQNKKFQLDSEEYGELLQSPFVAIAFYITVTIYGIDLKI